MLLRFSASNHGSIFERQELSLVATSLKDNESALIPTDALSGKSVLPVAVIYGSNASGKSTILDAYKFIESSIIQSHPKGTLGGAIQRNVFALDDTASEKPSVYDVDFISQGVRYHYGFEATDAAFTKEWLYGFPTGRKQMLFERSDERTIEFGRSLKGRNRIIADLMRPNSLYLSAALQNNHETLSSIASIFVNQAHVEMISVGGATVSKMFEEHDIDDKVLNFLAQIKTGIVGYRKVEHPVSEEQKKFQQHFDEFLRKMRPKFQGQTIEKTIAIELLHRSRNGEEVAFRPQQESSGTRRLLILLTGIFAVLNEGGAIRIDELDASLHTQAAEAIIQLFSSKQTNPNGAQLIATTHDTNLMRTPLLRRDQIWFVEKNDYGATCLYPLAEIQVRKDDNLERGYLQGRFGAIPFAGPVDIFNVVR